MKKQSILIVGTKTLSLMIADLCVRLSVPVRGYIDDGNPSKIWNGKPIIGTIENVLEQKNIWKKFGIAVGIGDNANRMRVAEQFLKEGFLLPTLTDPSCVIFRSATIQNGTLIFPFSFVGTNVIVEKGSIILPHVTLTHDDSIGEYSFLSSGVTVAGRVRIRAMTKISIGSLVPPDTTIPKNDKIKSLKKVL